jgi:hypothetical protein
MGKYASWSEFERSVPTTYAERATPEAYRTGMNGIAPNGMKVKEGRVNHYRAAVAAAVEQLPCIEREHVASHYYSRR